MKSYRTALAIASLLLVLYLVAEWNKPAPTNWQTTLYYNDKIPFGTYIFYHELNQLFPGAALQKTNQPAIKVFGDTTLSNGNYFIVAKTVNINRPEFDAITKYIARGNSVFIATFSFNGFLADTLKLGTDNDYDEKKITLNFTNPQLKAAGGYTVKAEQGQEYFSRFDSLKGISLSQNQHKHTNYLRFNYGKGSLYLLSTPFLLTNHGLLNAGSPRYIEKALSYLKPVNQLYWDQYQNHDVPEDDSPMRVFFEHENLRWAYYIALASFLLFVVYEAKRRQRVIPVIDPLQNTTLEFVDVVGRVYYEQRNNANIALKKISYLSDYLRSHYRLKVEFMNKDFAERLSNKSGADISLIRDLVSHINYISIEPQVSDHDLITLNNLIDTFYAQT